MSASLFSDLRDDLALVTDLPLYAVDEDAVEAFGGRFTLEMQEAFVRITDALPHLLAAAEAASKFLDLIDGRITRGWHEANDLNVALVHLRVYAREANRG